MCPHYLVTDCKFCHFAGWVSAGTCKTQREGRARYFCDKEDNGVRKTICEDCERGEARIQEMERAKTEYAFCFAQYEKAQQALKQFEVLVEEAKMAKEAMELRKAHHVKKASQSAGSGSKA